MVAIPSLGDLPNPGTKPVSPALQTNPLLTKLQGSPILREYCEPGTQ